MPYDPIYKKRMRENNKEMYLATERAYRERNREKIRKYWQENKWKYNKGVSVRFQVFLRDNFTCQYCGRKSPDVVLHADHVLPVSRGGHTTIENMTTACQECNLGKSDLEM